MKELSIQEKAKRLDAGAWLERKGEQKPTDKVEPKFRVGDTIKCKYDDRQFTIKSVDLDKGTYTYTQEGCGNDIDYADEEFELVEHSHVGKDKPRFKVGDWVVSPNGVYWHIVAIRDGRYQVCSDSGEIADWPLDTNIYHKFTLQDAKDGDVLVLNDEVFIYSHRKQMYSIAVAHCFVDSAGNFRFDGEFGYTEKGNSIHPSTKEQREQIKKAMTKAGYDFDFEKKKLKKIEQNLATMTLDEAIKHCEEKSCGNNACALEHKQLKKWLSELKELKENKPAWSEEDEENRIYSVKYLELFNARIHRNAAAPCINWLISLKDRYTWKPSDEQIEALEHFVRSIGESGYASPYDNNNKLLYSLLSDLKKLKKE